MTQQTQIDEESHMKPQISAILSAAILVGAMSSTSAQQAPGPHASTRADEAHKFCAEQMKASGLVRTAARQSNMTELVKTYHACLHSRMMKSAI